jgi:hypothetical protein
MNIENSSGVCSFSLDISLGPSQSSYDGGLSDIKVTDDISKSIICAHILRMFQPSLKLTYSLYLCVQSCCNSC